MHNKLQVLKRKVFPPVYQCHLYINSFLCCQCSVPFDIRLWKGTHFSMNNEWIVSILSILLIKYPWCYSIWFWFLFEMNEIRIKKSSCWFICINTVYLQWMVSAPIIIIPLSPLLFTEIISATLWDPFHEFLPHKNIVVFYNDKLSPNK